MILIIGAPEEQHAAYIFQKIQERGGEAVYFDTRRFPTQIRLGFSPGEPSGSITIDDRKIPLSQISAVYWRYFMGLRIPETITDNFQREMAYREIDSAIGGLFRCMDRALWVNSPHAIEMHTHKPYQLKLLKDANIRIPETLITNDPEVVRAFYDKLNGNVIFKPVRGGAHTAKLKEKDLTPDRLAELAKAPVQFQELIEGVDIRIYLVKDELFAAEIRSKTLDFRDDPGADIVPVDLPDTVQTDCRKLAKAFGLVLSGIDVRKTPQGEYVFLEGNPSPMFIHFEKTTGYPISDRLVEMLLTGNA